MPVEQQIAEVGTLPSDISTLLHSPEPEFETREEQQGKLKEGVVYKGRCICWKRYWGLLREFRTNRRISVQWRNINMIGYKELVEGSHYSFQVEATDRKFAEGIKVTPL